MTIKVFYCYAHEDKDLRDQLDQHLSVLKYLGLIKSWYDGEISAGTPWKQAIADHFHTADLILLLVSSSFLSSNYCYHTQVAHALERHQQGKARVIPVLLRPVDWHGIPLSELAMLPNGQRPVTSWEDQNAAFENVARGIRRAVEEMMTADNSKSSTVSVGHLSSPSLSHSAGVFSHLSAFRGTSFLRNLLVYGITDSIGLPIFISILKWNGSIGRPVVTLSICMIFALSGYLLAKPTATYQTACIHSIRVGILFGIAAVAFSSLAWWPLPLLNIILIFLTSTVVSGICNVLGAWLAIYRRR